MNRSWTGRLRGSPLVSVLIIILIGGLLAGGLYVGDRYAHRRAEQQVAALLQTQLGTPQAPTVSIAKPPVIKSVSEFDKGSVQYDDRIIFNV